MLTEIQRIPPAPRRVAWGRVLGYRWPLGLLTFLLTIYGGVFTWMLWLAHSDNLTAQQRFTAGPRAHVVAVVRAAHPAASPSAQAIRYAFGAGGQTWEGSGEVQAGTLAEGHAIDVEYLVGEPRHNAIAGQPLPRFARRFDPGTAFAVLVVPGLLLGICYAAGVFHLRRVLTHGDAGQAQVTDIRRVRWCVPEAFSVRYTFRDHRAHERHGRHWVRVHSALGERLLTMVRHGSYDRLPVLHDRTFPQHSRLVLPCDFGPDRHPIDPAATIRL